MTLSRKQITTLVVACVAGIALLAVAWLGLFKGQVDRVSAARESVAAQGAENARLETRLVALQEKADAIESAKDDAAKLYAQFPTTSDQASWIKMINEAAADAGVTADAISPSVPSVGVAADAAVDPAAAPAAAEGESLSPEGVPADASAAEAPAANLATIDVTLSVSGSDAGIREFVEKVEDLQQPLLVGEFAITASAETLTANITGRTFLMRAVPEPILPAE